MNPIFYPKSIVVLGVSEKANNLAKVILLNLRRFEYRGEIYAVGRERGEIYGVPISASLDEMPDGIDLAVFLTPAASIPDLLEACGRKGIRHAVIESAGFGEFSQEGSQLEKRLLQIAERDNIRFVGPNCISLINLENGLCLPFVSISPQTVRLGGVSIVTQSGGVFVTYLDRFSLGGVGVDKLVSIGNKINLNENDYLSYFLEDKHTRIVCLYLESISDGRRLMDLVSSSSKPIIVHKSNRGQASQGIAMSHTAALGSDDRIVSAALRQAGAIRVNRFQQAVAAAQALCLPPVRNKRLLVISRSGGHAILAADASEELGFELMTLPADFYAWVQANAPANVIQPTNPVDVGAAFNVDFFTRVLQESLKLNPGSILLIHTNLDEGEAEITLQLARNVERLAVASDVPIAFCVYSQGRDSSFIQNEVGIPVFQEVEDALYGLATAQAYYQRKCRRSQQAPSSCEAQELPTETISWLDQPGVVTSDRALQVCQSYGIPIAPMQVVAASEEAAQAAEELGFPVAVKLLSEKVLHKTDAGGVVLNLTDATSVQMAARTMLSGTIGGAHLLVQTMVKKGQEVILGAKRDPTFGPVVMFGLGGVWVEMLKDVAFRVAPLGRDDAEEMIQEIQGSKILKGYRGQPPVNHEALVHALLALSRMVVENPQIAEIDINPLLASNDGVIAVDARILVSAYSPRADMDKGE